MVIPVKRELECLFGSPSQEKLLYLLMMANGRWCYPYDVHRSCELDEKTVRIILKRFVKIFEDFEHDPTYNRFRILPQSGLLNLLESMFLFFESWRLKNYQDKKFWLARVPKSHDEKYYDYISFYKRGQANFIGILSEKKRNLSLREYYMTDTLQLSGYFNVDTGKMLNW